MGFNCQWRFASLCRRIGQRPFRFLRLAAGSIAIVVLIIHFCKGNAPQKAGPDGMRIRAKMVLKHDNPAHSSSEIVSPPPPSGSSSPFTRLSSPPPPRNKILPFRPVSKIKIEDNFSRSHTPLELAESFQQPISIAMLTPHYFGEGYARLVPDCSFAGVPLHCTYYGLGNNQSTEATALWWHAPGMCPLHYGPWPERRPSSTFKGRDDQFAIVASMESSAYHTCLDSEEYMKQFDITSTYRIDSDVPLTYFNLEYKHLWETTPHFPSDLKQNAIVSISSNCKTPIRRDFIISALAEQPGIRVDSLGKCLAGPAQLPEGPGQKHEAFRRYKFCIAIENSVAVDYVTEKVYDAFAAGCVPIYLGAPNIRDFIPTMEAIVDYREFRDPESLAKEIKRLLRDSKAYAKKLAWREDPQSWGMGFKALIKRAEQNIHPQCRVCQIIAERRAKNGW